MSKRRTRIWLIGGAFALSLLFLCAYSLKIFEPLPLEAAAASSRIIVDRNGKIVSAFTTPDGRWRLDAKPDDVSPTYLALLFAFEDHRFWRHPGIDPLAFGRAVLQAVSHGKPISGGSTITMQVARLLRGSPTHSFIAKFQQIADAARLEWCMSKSEILSLYLKLAPYGGNLQGVRAASLVYFGKEPRRLSVAEAALLVTIPQAPEIRRPGRGYRSLVHGRNLVIRRGVAAGVIGREDAKAALEEVVPLSRRALPSPALRLSNRLMTVDVDGVDNRPARSFMSRNAQSFRDKVSIAR